MSETKAAAETQDETTEVVISEGDKSGVAAIMGTLEDAFKKKDVIVNMAARYLSLEKDESMKLVYLTTTSQEVVNEKTGEIETQETALFVDEDKTTWVNKNVVIRNAVKSISKGSTVLITMTGETDLGGGKRLHNFDVQLLG